MMANVDPTKNLVPSKAKERPPVEKFNQAANDAERVLRLRAAFNTGQIMDAALQKLLNEGLMKAGLPPKGDLPPGFGENKDDVKELAALAKSLKAYLTEHPETAQKLEVLQDAASHQPSQPKPPQVQSPQNDKAAKPQLGGQS